MTKYIYLIKDVPFQLINEFGRYAKYVQGITKDAKYECDLEMNSTTSADFTDSSLTYEFLSKEVLTDDQLELLNCMMHNLHGAKLIEIVLPEMV